MISKFCDILLSLTFSKLNKEQNKQRQISIIIKGAWVFFPSYEMGNYHRPHDMVMRSKVPFMSLHKNITCHHIFT